MPAVAGTLQLTAQANVAGVLINPQGTAATVTLTQPSAGAVGTGELDLSFGTASGQGDLFCAGDFDLGAGASVTWDLFSPGTDFKDVFGQAALFRKLRAIFVAVISGGDTAGVTIGNAATNILGLWFGAVAQTWTIYPSSVPFCGGQPAGLTVDATHRNLKVLNNGAVAATVRVVLVGSSV